MLRSNTAFTISIIGGFAIAANGALGLALDASIGPTGITVIPRIVAAALGGLTILATRWIRDPTTEHNAYVAILLLCVTAIPVAAAAGPILGIVGATVGLTSR